jgi:hypothetical protein
MLQIFIVDVKICYERLLSLFIGPGFMGRTRRTSTAGWMATENLWRLFMVNL